MTSGYSFSLLKFRTTTSRDIEAFISALVWFIKLSKGFEGKEIGIILDNCATHRTKIIYELAKKKSIRLFYLPAYTPELAPIETYFSYMKNLTISKAGGDSINLKSKGGMKLVSEVIQSIKCDYIKSLWISYMNLLKEEVTKIDAELAHHTI